MSDARRLLTRHGVGDDGVPCDVGAWTVRARKWRARDGRGARSQRHVRDGRRHAGHLAAWRAPLAWATCAYTGVAAKRRPCASGGVRVYGVGDAQVRLWDTSGGDLVRPGDTLTQATSGGGGGSGRARDTVADAKTRRARDGQAVETEGARTRESTARPGRAAVHARVTDGPRTGIGNAGGVRGNVAAQGDNVGTGVTGVARADDVGRASDEVRDKMARVFVEPASVAEDRQGDGGARPAIARTLGGAQGNEVRAVGGACVASRVTAADEARAASLARAQAGTQHEFAARPPDVAESGRAAGVAQDDVTYADGSRGTGAVRGNDARGTGVVRVGNVARVAVAGRIEEGVRGEDRAHVSGDRRAATPARVDDGARVNIDAQVNGERSADDARDNGHGIEVRVMDRECASMADEVRLPHAPMAMRTLLSARKMRTWCAWTGLRTHTTVHNPLSLGLIVVRDQSSRASSMARNPLSHGTKVRQR